MINCSVLFGLNLTSQFSDHLCIFSRSVFIRSAAIAGSSTIRYRDVSSANNLIQEFMSLTISFIYIKGTKVAQVLTHILICALNGEWLENLFVSKNTMRAMWSYRPFAKKSGQLYKEGVSISKITAFV